MASASALVYVSLFEGFGIPIVEAMNCDVPVITSNDSSMPEIAGDAGLLADPFSVTDIAAKMKMLCDDEVLRQELVSKGKIQRQKFTWQRTADRLWECVMRSVNDSHH
jgi:glycosyltransferase involved in cell wall biosynthesis